MTVFRANGFDSELPQGWSDRSMITLVGPTSQDGFAANLVVTRQPLERGTSVTAFGQSQVEAIANEVEEVKVQFERTANIREREVFQRIHEIRVGDRWIRQVQAYYVVDRDGQRTGFVVTGSTSPEAFEEALPAIQHFIAKFEPHGIAA